MRLLSLAALALVLVLLDGCAGAMRSGHRVTNADVTIVSFGSVQGELAPCG
jgi:hypothetical protein